MNPASVYMPLLWQMRCYLGIGYMAYLAYLFGTAAYGFLRNHSTNSSVSEKTVLEKCRETVCLSATLPSFYDPR